MLFYKLRTNQGISLLEVMILLAILGIIAAVILPSTACSAERPAKASKVTESEKAKKAADSIKFTENAEIDNIKKRLELTSDPGLTGFILLMNEAGQPIMYTGIKGKITSGSKRLTRPWSLYRGDGGQYTRDFITSAPSDEGTWGSSSPYIYFWTTSGQYMQWNGKYLYSDKPFRTRVEPLVIADANFGQVPVPATKK